MLLISEIFIQYGEYKKITTTMHLSIEKPLSFEVFLLDIILFHKFLPLSL